MSMFGNSTSLDDTFSVSFQHLSLSNLLAGQINVSRIASSLLPSVGRVETKEGGAFKRFDLGAVRSLYPNC